MYTVITDTEKPKTPFFSLLIVVLTERSREKEGSFGFYALIFLPTSLQLSDASHSECPDTSAGASEKSGKADAAPS